MGEESGGTDWAALGQRVREARVSLGLTQDQLGQLTEQSKNRITRLEGGEPVGEGVLARVAEVIRRSLPWLRYGVATATDLAAAREEAWRFR